VKWIINCAIPAAEYYSTIKGMYSLITIMSGSENN
jgi:hypothetical protein